MSHSPNNARNSLRSRSQLLDKLFKGKPLELAPAQRVGALTTALSKRLPAVKVLTKMVVAVEEVRRRPPMRRGAAGGSKKAVGGQGLFGVVGFCDVVEFQIGNVRTWLEESVKLLGGPARHRARRAHPSSLPPSPPFPGNGGEGGVHWSAYE